MGLFDYFSNITSTGGSTDALGGWLPALSTAGSMASTLYQNYENRAMVQQQENFQAGMADTIYQRGVADLKAAGLNPVLAAGGATDPAPGGAMQTMQGFHNPVDTAISTASGVSSAKVVANQADTTSLDAEIARRVLHGYIDADDQQGPMVQGIADSEYAKRVAAGRIADSQTDFANSNAEVARQQAIQEGVKSKLLGMSLPLATNASKIQENAPFLNWINAVSAAIHGTGQAVSSFPSGGSK